jgi:hypothetical protein
LRQYYDDAPIHSPFIAAQSVPAVSEYPRAVMVADLALVLRVKGDVASAAADISELVAAFLDIFVAASVRGVLGFGEEGVDG